MFSEEKLLSYHRRAQDFFDSALLQYLYFAAAILIDTFSNMELVFIHVTYYNHVVFYGLIGFVVVLSVHLLLCRHLSTTILPFLLACTFPLKCYDCFDQFMQIACLALPFAGAVLLRIFVLYRKPFYKDEIFRSLIPVAVAVTLGGLGTLPLLDYLKAGYYVVGLGVGMLALYYIFSTQYEPNDTHSMAEDYERAMCLLALFCTYMIIHFYLLNRETVLKTHALLDFQWRNNISTLLMIALPFPFLRAHKQFAWFFLGIVCYGGMVLAASRGALIFGTLEFGICILVYLIQVKGKYRYIALGFCGVCAAVCLTLAVKNLETVKELFFRFFNTFASKENLEKETRYQLIFRTKDDFLRNPVFGSGLGYSGNADIYNPKKGALYFYHSAPLQIVGSLGLLGIFAYGYQLWVQGKLLWKIHSRFALTVAVSILSLWGMSIVNPGVFAPIPYAMLIPLSLLIAKRDKATLPQV